MIEYQRLWDSVVEYCRLIGAGSRYLVQIKVLRPYEHTRGYENFDEFDNHYPRHGREHTSFGRTAFSYARFADSFCGGPRDPNTTLEHIMRDGTIVRCNPTTRIVGVLHVSGFIGTCHVRRDALKWFQNQQKR